METTGSGYTVSKLAQLAGTSVRTLHHYDEIGLLRPLARSPAGYRLYSEGDLLRLQQILFYRELDMPLADIRQVLDDPAFDPLAALAEHRRALRARARRIDRLLRTIDRTIYKLSEQEMDEDKVTDAELYEGFTAEQREAYGREVQERYDPAIVAESNRRVRNLSKAEWQALKQEGDDVTSGLAVMMDRPPDDPQVQALAARHFAMMNRFYDVTPEIYRGLAQLYVADDRFRATYDKVRPGLADFLQQVMAVYAGRLEEGA